MSSAGRSRGGREAAPLRLSPSCVSQHLTINSNSNSNSNSNNNNNNDNDNNLQDSEYSNRSNSRSNRNPRSAHWASGQCRGHAELNRSFYLAAVCVLLAAGHWPAGTYCLEQDAEVLKPVANIAKSMIRTVTLGDPLEIHLDPTGLAKNFAYFTWRTGFPINMPKGFIQKAQDFYNRVKSRADQTPVDDVERKTLASLKVELDKIVDDIVAEVGQSPDGLYTDYLQTRVNGVPLEDACTAVAVQLKAYGVDLTNYRDIAGIVLGIPVIPSVASAMMNVANLASMEAMANLTSMAINPLSTSGELLNQLPGSALRSVSKVSNSALNSILLLSGGHGTAASQEQARADGEAAAAAQPVFA